jgi:hypothetical protein
MTEGNNHYGLLELQAFANQIYGGRPLVMVPYGYALTFSALAQNATQTQQLSITANADFILTGLKYRASIGAAETVSNKTAAFVRILITDSGTNEQFTSGPVDLENYATNGASQVGGLPYPRFISGRTALTVTATNFSPGGGQTYLLDLFLEGLLVRTYSGV